MSITTLSTHRQKLWTPFDDLGTFLGTPRRDDESLRDFKNRIKTVFTDRAGTHYEGLINGIAQEFGLEKKIAFSISLDNDTYPKWMALKNGAKVTIYDRYDSSDNYHILCDIDLRPNVTKTPVLVSDITKELLSYGVTVVSYDTSVVSEPAFFLINTQSHDIFKETLPVSKTYNLEKNSIIPGSINFDRSGVFINEVASYSDLSNDGDYCINYKEGVIYAYSYIGDNNVSFSYIYNSNPFFLYYIPVCVNNFYDNSYVNTLFQQVEQKVYENESDKYKNTIPKAEFIGFLDELKNLTKVYWGK